MSHWWHWNLWSRMKQNLFRTITNMIFLSLNHQDFKYSSSGKFFPEPSSSHKTLVNKILQIGRKPTSVMQSNPAFNCQSHTWLTDCSVVKSPSYNSLCFPLHWNQTFSTASTHSLLMASLFWESMMKPELGLFVVFFCLGFCFWKELLVTAILITHYGILPHLTFWPSRPSSSSNTII